MILRWLASATIVILALLSALYFYFFHIDTPSQPELKGQFKHSQLEVKNDKRTFAYYVPQTLPANPPVVFVLHGSRGNGSDMRKQTGYEFDRIAETEGFIVVYPDGYENHWNDCRASAEYSANTENKDDPAFFEMMFSYFVESYGADPALMFMTGFSNGGHLSYRLAFEMPDRIAAIAPIAANLPVDDNLDCIKKGKAVPVAIFNGTEDPVNPYNGGLVALLGNTSRGTVHSSTESANYWKNLASITGVGQTTKFAEVDGDPSTEITMERWDGRNGIQVRLYTLHGSGHVIPSKNVRFGRFFGDNAGDIEAATEVWNFFSEVRSMKNKTLRESVDGTSISNRNQEHLSRTVTAHDD